MSVHNCFQEQVTSRKKSRRTDRTSAAAEESPETTTAASSTSHDQHGEPTPHTPAPSSVNKRKGRLPSKHLTGSKETEPQKKPRGYSLRKH